MWLYRMLSQYLVGSFTIWFLKECTNHRTDFLSACSSGAFSDLLNIATNILNLGESIVPIKLNRLQY